MSFRFNEDSDFIPLVVHQRERSTTEGGAARCSVEAKEFEVV